MDLSLDNVLKAAGLDQYQLKAQLTPALLAIWPVTAAGFLWAPDASKAMTALSNAAISIGIIYFLMNVGRSKGRAVQRALVERWGGLPTTVALRHRSTEVSSALRERYHATLSANGFAMPSRDAEEKDPAAADDKYQAVTEWLPNQTSDSKKFYLLHVENRNYGFCRNMLGLKPIGLTIVLLILAINGVGIYLSWQSRHLKIEACMLEAVLLMAAVAWTTLVTRSLVEAAAWAYAKQALASIEKLPRKRQPKSAAGKP